MAEDSLSICSVCDDIIGEFDKQIVCTNCKGVYHSECSSQMTNTFVYCNIWQCDECVGEPCVEAEESIIGIGSSMLEENEVVVSECDSPQIGPDLTLVGSIADDVKLIVFPDELGSGRLTNKDDIGPDKNYFANTNWDSSYATFRFWGNQVNTAESGFSILHIHCRSMTNKLDELESILNEMPVTILALTETWLPPEAADSFHIPGYNFIHKSRGVANCGVGMFIRKNIRFSALTNVKASDTFEKLFIQVHLQGSIYSVGVVVYRPPGLNLTDFNIEFEDLLRRSVAKGQELVIAGDFNVDLLKVNDHYETSQFHNCLTTYQLFPSITRPTRITSHSQTLIDNIFSSAWSKLVRAAIIVSDLPDHLPIVALFPTERNCKRAYYNTTSSRKINDENVGKFDALLADINWDPVKKISADGDANLAYDKFMEIYKTVYDKAFPIVLHRTNSKKPTFTQPWMTSGLLKSCKKKNLLYVKFIRSRSVANKDRFIKYRNKFKSIRLRVKKNFYEAEFSKINGDFRLTWKLIRTLMKVNTDEDHIEALKINGTDTSDPHAMANGLNDFFTNVAQSLAGKLKSPINHYSRPRYLPSPKLTSMGIIPTTPEEILDIGRTCKGTRSKGVDDVDPHLAGMHLHRIATTLSIIINCSLNTGIVPDAIKIAKIVPIFKKGEKNDVSNY